MREGYAERLRTSTFDGPSSNQHRGWNRGGFRGHSANSRRGRGQSYRHRGHGFNRNHGYRGYDGLYNGSYRDRGNNHRNYNPGYNYRSRGRRYLGRHYHEGVFNGEYPSSPDPRQPSRRMYYPRDVENQSILSYDESPSAEERLRRRSLTPSPQDKTAESSPLYQNFGANDCSLDYGEDDQPKQETPPAQSRDQEQNISREHGHRQYLQHELQREAAGSIQESIELAPCEQNTQIVSASRTMEPQPPESVQGSSVDKDEDGDVAMGAAEDPYTSEAATKKKEQDGSDSIVYDRASRESSISPWDGQEEDLVDYSD